MGKIKDLKGMKFNRLLVLEKTDKPKTANKNNRQSFWLCICDCGNKKTVASYSLTHGETKSCGCILTEVLLDRNKKMQKHNMTGERIYRIYDNMKRRCRDKNNKSFKDYGGRGITVCDYWLDREKGFINFYNWSMENGYNDSLTIDRVDNDGNYEPNNCKWTTIKEQARNKRSNSRATVNGKYYNTLIELSEDYPKIGYKNICNRYFHGDRDDRLIRAVANNGEKNKVHRE